ncbi:MAG TPA: O-antigen ligase family protein, partial [Vicinamibacterales bacterium]
MATASDLVAPFDHGRTSTEWWRPVTPDPGSGIRDPKFVAGRRRAPAESSGSDVAFGALVAFTAILLLSPQAWFPLLGTLRIAFLAAGVAIGAHLLDRLIRARDVPPMPTEILIALTLVAWAVLTLPLSYWPAGSVEVLADRYLKAIAFFWLIGTIVTTTGRLRVLAWTLVLCSIPLAATGVKNYLAGEVLGTGVRGFTRIYGYMGGSSIASNPNDLALMLNLIIPIAAALVWMSRRPAARALAAGALLLSVAAVIVTFSRAGFLALAASALMFMAVLVRRRKAGVAAGLLVLALGALPLLPAGYVDRLSTITDVEADRTGSARGRWRDTRVAIGVVAQNPVVGVGIGQDILAMNDERGISTWRRVHNAYLQYGVDLGVPGLLLFVWLHVMCFRTARAVEVRTARDPALCHLAHLAAGVQVALVVFGVEALFHPIAYQF